MVYLVYTYHDLPDSKGIGQKDMLQCLSVCGYSRLELPRSAGYHKKGHISVYNTVDRAFDVVLSAWSSDNVDSPLFGLNMVVVHLHAAPSLFFLSCFVHNSDEFLEGVSEHCQLKF